MSSYPPPNPTWPILTPQTFNNDFFTNTDEGLSLDNAYKYFLRLTGGTLSGNLNILLDLNAMGNTYLNTLYIDNVLVNSTANELNYNAGITLGIGSNNKVLTLNNVGNVSGINTLTTKTLDVDSTNNTAISLSGGSENYALHLHTNTNGSGTSYGSAISFNYNAGTNQVPLSAIALDRIDNKTGDLVFYNRNNINNIQENFRMRSTGEFKCVSLNINNVALTASATELNYLDFSGGYTLGVCEASKAVVLDASRNTSNINNLTATNFIGSNLSLSSANLNNFNTSSTNATVITASSFTNQYDMYLRKPTTTNGQTLGIAFHITTNDVASQTAGASLIFTRTGAGAGYLSLTTSAVERLRISETGIVSIYNTTNSTTPTTGALVLSGGLGVGGHVRLANNGRVWINSEFGFSHGNSVNGTAEVITYNNGINGSYIGTYTSHNFGVATAGVIRIGVDTSGNVNIVNHNNNTIGLRLNNVLITASANEINYLDLTTGTGTAEINKALVLDSSGNITGITGLTSTNLNCTTLSLGGTAITASASELNYLAGTTVGSAVASKALVVNGSRDINNINSLTATNLTGLLQTANQSLITDLGTLNALNVSGLVNFSNTTQSSSAITGALILAGGMGINKKLYVNDNITTNAMVYSTNGFNTSNGRIIMASSDLGLSHVSSTGAIKSELVSYSNGTITAIGSYNAFPFCLYVQDTERVRISTSGNMSIGNTNNTYKLDITGDCNVSGAFRVNGSALPAVSDLEKISGITNGTALANKALVLDSSKEIKDINKITTTELVVDDDITINSGNIFVKENLVGTGGNITIDDRLTCRSIRIEDVSPSINVKIFGSKIDILSGNNFGIGTLSNDPFFLFANDNYTGFYVMPNGKFGFNTNDPQYTADIEGSCNALSYYIDGTQITSSAAELNVLDGFTGTTTQLNYLSGITLGTITASKVLTVDSNSDINSILRLKKTANSQQIYFENGTSTGTMYQFLNGSLNFGTISANDLVFQTNNLDRITITSAGLMNILGGWQISGSTVSASADELNYNDITTIGVGQASKSLVLNGDRDISNIRKMELNGNDDILTFTNTVSTGRSTIKFVGNTGSGTGRNWELGTRNATASVNPNTFYLYDNSASSYRLLVDSDGNVNIVAHNGLSKGLQLGGTLITASASELNYCDVSAGAGTANKAMVLDGNRDINNINVMYGNTFQASNQLIATNANAYFRILPHSDSVVYMQAGLTSGAQSATDLFIGNAGVDVAGSNRKIMFKSTGRVGFGTSAPDKALEINSSDGNCLRLTYNDSNGSATYYSDLNVSSSGQLTVSTASNNANTVGGDILLKGSVIIGKDNTYNLLRFNGTTGDANANNTVIGERLYSGTEASELLLFKGNDIVGASGSDRIRLRANTHYFQTYTSAEDYSGLLDNNTRLFIAQDGKIGVNTTSPSYQLDVSGDLNITGSYRISGSAVDFSAITGLTLGTITASKAITVDSSSNINSILRLKKTANSQQIYFENGTSTGTMYQFLNGSLNFGSISANDLVFQTNNLDRITIKSNGNVGINNSNPSRALEVNGEISSNTKLVCGTSGYQMALTDGTIELISYINNAIIANTAFWGTVGNHDLAFQSNALQRMTVKGDGKVGINTTTPSYQLHVDGGIKTNSYLLVGSSTDTSRMISCLDSGQATSSSRYICIGRETTSGNQAEIDFYYAGSGSTDNRLNLGFYGGPVMSITYGNRVGIGTTAPTTGLDVAVASNNVTTTTNILVNTYSYNISDNTHSNLGGGPVTVAMCARFRSNVWIQDKIYATSDRRLKTDISTLDFTLEHYNKLNPVSYKWINDPKTHIGLIAQELKDVCAESINIVENENMKKETDEDIEGHQYTVDYNCINMMNVVAIKKLIEKNNSLEERLKKLEDFISTINIEYID